MNMFDNVPPFLLIIIGLFVGIIIMFIFNYVKNILNKGKIENLLEKAKGDAEKIKKDYLAEAKNEAAQYKIDVENELKDRKTELKNTEERILQRESNMDKREELIHKRELTLDEKESNLVDKQKEIQVELASIEDIKKEQVELLEKIAGYSKKEARDLVLKRVEDMMNLEIASYIKDRETEAKLEADKKAKELLVESMQRYASDVSNEQTVTVVELPNDEMKGRIIGREGRNIRSIEAVTGVDLIIDDTPEAIVLSSFDPLRREMARVTLETLIKDGRIHPSRIEEVYDKVSKDMKAEILEYGNNALFELGLTKVEPELVELLGKLHFRTSYGQNVLTHSIEVANLAGIMASEIGENVALAKRAGLFHDIGKAIDHEVEGSHVDLGVNLATKYHENDTVINAIASHHGDTGATSVISCLVAIADALSASRPGARNDSLENYVQRLQELEAIGNNMEGVDKTFAMQAGRELRVIVKPEQIDDLGSVKIARDIKNQIEETMQYPGTIKVIVIRETRSIEEAK